MRNLIRSPLTWMVIAECVVVGALIVAAWNIVGAASPAFASPPLTLPPASGEASSPMPNIPESGAPGPRGPLPGLNLDSAFWRLRLAQLNHDQVIFEKLEWRIIHNAMDAVHRYLETVVLPAIQEAEKVRGGGLVP